MDGMMDCKMYLHIWNADVRSIQQKPCLPVVLTPRPLACILEQGVKLSLPEYTYRSWTAHKWHIVEICAPGASGAVPKLSVIYAAPQAPVPHHELGVQHVLVLDRNHISRLFILEDEAFCDSFPRC